jgi:PBSX family phage terminase large subunit
MSTTLPELIIPSPELRGANLALGACRDLEVCLDGPAGSGKTVAALFKVHIMLLMNPGSKALVARKTNTALAGSAIVTYREQILNENENVKYFGGSKIRPAAFEYPNGSVLVVNGLDKREKIKSWEFDIAYINEATECDEEDIEYVRSRLRHGKMPYHQLMMDCNPDAPEHWLNQRMESGKTTRLLSRHEDNPRFWDVVKQDWTPEGYEYIFVVLGGLTGVLLERMRFGVWAAAFGTIYQGVWDRKRNVIDRFDIPRSYPRYLCIDFGYTHPFVCKWYAMDPDGRLICYREIYMTKQLVEDHCKDIAIASGWFHLLPKDHEQYQKQAADWADPLPREVICDHDAEDRATLQRHLKMMTTAADKSVSDGIQAVAVRLRVAGDGKPRLMYFRDCLVKRDEDLAKRKRPTCSVEEFNVYVWAKKADQSEKEEPQKENDHGMDVDRYIVARFDLMPAGVTYYKNIWR